MDSKSLLNDLLVALGAISAPIEGDDERLEASTRNVIEHFSAITPEEKFWYIVFLRMSPIGQVLGNIVIKDTHPLVWANENSASERKVISAGTQAIQGDIVVLNFVPITADVAKKLKNAEANSEPG